ncbi:uncharacterized protein KD926_000466 [Aspergillus affinis]|uniref:uncharacterized protein n=1 Tax=Aspergillus affinis TaxID=1070780 RepID=UPI0022FF26DD|nr:uncharacterized protein KD926_000466 [Aspergillus affinis]KAI9044555.1 hypothetical protein KD926_000466 [Aspergillus affinis]
MSGILHKVKEAVTHHHHHDTSHKSDKAHAQNPTTTQTQGPHSSNAANKADPRVDSDLDGRGVNPTTTISSGPYLHGAVSPNDKPTYNRAWTGDSDGISPRTSTVNTNANAYDAPRTDDPSTGPAPSTAGPHSSNVANKADPRVDSDLSSAKAKEDTSRFYNEVRQGSIGGAGIIHASGSNGPTTTKTFDPHASLPSGGAPQIHSSSAAGSSYNTPGSGRASHTAGPHDSDVANKMDPRVDSDLDGSRTMGAQRDGY